MPVFRLRKWITTVSSNLPSRHSAQMNRRRRKRQRSEVAVPADVCETRVLLTTGSGVEDASSTDSDSQTMAEMVTSSDGSVNEYGTYDNYADSYNSIDFYQEALDSPVGEDLANYGDYSEVYSTYEMTAEEMDAKGITVLPGSYLSRTVDGHNPGADHVRMALVAELDECIEAAQRIKSFLQNLTPGETHE